MPRRALYSIVTLAVLLAGCGARAGATPRGLSPVEAPWTRFLTQHAPDGARAPAGLPPNDVPTRPLDFRSAKTRLDREVYLEKRARHEIYCGCAYDGDRAIDPGACGYAPLPRGAERASRMEWDHAVPFSRFGRLFACYHDPRREGRSRREHCVDVEPALRAIEGDMHNLHPSLGQVNALREDFDLAEIEGEAHVGGCDFEVDPRTRRAEPRPEARGELARAYLYMHVTYRLPLTDDERARFLAWHEADPPTEWERTRAERILALQGNDNPFVTGRPRAR